MSCATGISESFIYFIIRFMRGEEVNTRSRTHRGYLAMALAIAVGSRFDVSYWPQAQAPRRKTPTAKTPPARDREPGGPRVPGALESAVAPHAPGSGRAAASGRPPAAALRRSALRRSAPPLRRRAAPCAWVASRI